MLDVLLKKAKGYEVVETTQEFGFDEEGNKKLLKEKVATKSVPPDLSAIKAYMEMEEGELFAMTEKELLQEKERLLKDLGKTAKKNKKTNKEVVK